MKHATTIFQVPNKVTDGPYLFSTGTGRLGMIWTSWIYDVYTQGVAYSKSGNLEGPWIQEKEPINCFNNEDNIKQRTLAVLTEILHEQ